MTLQDHFNDYIKAGLYLKGWSPKTAVVYRRAFSSFQSSLPEGSPCPERVGNGLTKAQLEAWVVSMRHRGMSPAGCNIYIRAMNAFGNWLKEQELIERPTILRQVKVPTETLRVFSKTEVQNILQFRPRRFSDIRLYTLISVLVDTGLRIDEALSMKPADVDLDNLLICVVGKGNKERKVSMSLRLRKLIFRYMEVKKKRGIPPNLLFCTKSGLPVRYRNTYRDIKRLCKQVGVEGEYVRPHCFRHFFAVHYINSGGSVVHLSRILGHCSISVTQVYLRSMNAEELPHHSALS